ncbi:MAG: ABC transporter ATP-binding protein [Bacillota bacterium]|nr:ABC transporter ATP-binding protein [Bacillota bacterium]
MLQVNSLSVYYNGIQVLWDASFTVEKGSITALVGSNSSGKSTTMNTVVGLLKPASGSIIFQEEEITGLGVYQRVERGICLVPEGRRIFPHLTVKENLEIGSYVQRCRRDMHYSLEWVYDLFPRLKERNKQAAGTLSGGEQQMLAIGRGLMSKPTLLMLDEPSIGLAPVIVNLLFELIVGINNKGVTILIVEQNLQKTLQIAQKVYVLETGKIVAEGRGEELLDCEDIKKAYLGM